MADKVITAPLAIIKVAGVPIGKMRNIRVQESFTRARVQGLGQLHKDEIPAVSWDGTLTCGFFSIDFRKSQIPGAILRTVNTIDAWADTVLLQEDGIQLDILKKVKDQVLPSGQIVPKFVVFASVVGCFMNRESFDISEGQVGGRDQEFEYLEPILFPL